MMVQKIPVILLLSSFIPLVITSSEPPFLLHHRKMKGSFIAWPALHSIKLKCKANGTAPLQFRWLKDGKPIMNRRLQPVLRTNQWFLRIRDLVPSDTGDYTCIVWNPYGKVNHTYTLHVVSKARSRPILDCSHPRNTTIARHNSVKLRCIVTLSGSLPDFRWLHWKTTPSNYEKSLNFKTGHFTVIDPIHYKTIDAGKDGEHGVELHLQNVTAHDFGLYTCIASNHLGQDYRSAFLIESKHHKLKRRPTKNRDITRTIYILTNQQPTDLPEQENEGDDKNIDSSAKNSAKNDSWQEPRIPLSTFIGTVAGIFFVLAGFILWFHYHHKKKEIIHNATLL